MAVLVHISKAENEKSILKNGIKLNKQSESLYFMPHTSDFLISHQWARELKRDGIKNFLAVDFKLPTDQLVWFGKYFEGHEKMPLNTAITQFLSQEDKYGYEFILERKVEPSEIFKTRHIPKPMGWRYEPNAHGKAPCPCPACIKLGGFKTADLKEKRLENMSREQARDILLISKDEDELCEALRRMQGKSRKESPEYLARLLNSHDEYVLYDLVELLSEHRHPLAKKYLEIMAQHEDEDASELAKQYLAALFTSTQS